MIGRFLFFLLFIGYLAVLVNSNLLQRFRRKKQSADAEPSVFSG